MKPDESGPAFPVIGMDGRNSQTFLGVYHSGMTLRDYFAAAALTGLMAKVGPEKCDGDGIKELAQYAAKYSYHIAYAMLAAREAK